MRKKTKNKKTKKQKQIVSLPLGKMPGSIKVAIQKLARTNINIMPLYIGTATENSSESQGHL